MLVIFVGKRPQDHHSRWGLHCMCVAYQETYSNSELKIQLLFAEDPIMHMLKSIDYGDYVVSIIYA